MRNLILLLIIGIAGSAQAMPTTEEVIAQRNQIDEFMSKNLPKAQSDQRFMKPVIMGKTRSGQECAVTEAAADMGLMLHPQISYSQAYGYDYWFSWSLEGLQTNILGFEPKWSFSITKDSLDAKLTTAENTGLIYYGVKAKVVGKKTYLSIRNSRRLLGGYVECVFDKP